MIHDAFDEYDLPPCLAEQLASHITSLPEHLQTGFLMRFCHEDSSSDSTKDRAIVSAITIALGYFFGGLIPLLPYALAGTVQLAFTWSVCVMVVALFAFGAGKTWLLVENGESLGQPGTGYGEASDLWEKQRSRQRRPRAWGKCLKGGAEMLVLGTLAAGAAMGIIKVLT